MEKIEFRIGSPKSPLVIRLEEYRGVKLLDIRKYFRVSKDSDEISPTRKGISLTGQQFSMALDALNENKDAIERHFSSCPDLKMNQKLDFTVGSPLGRLFQFSFENKSTDVLLDKKLVDKLEEGQSTILVNLLLLFHKALMEALDDEEDRELVLDSLNHGIGGTIC